MMSMSRFAETLDGITDMDSCLAVKSRLFTVADVNVDGVVDQCEIAYGCLMANRPGDTFECMTYANQMPSLNMTNLGRMCEEEWPAKKGTALLESTFLSSD